MGSLDSKRHETGLHTTQVFYPPGPHLSAWTMNLLLWEGQCRKALEASPRLPGLSTLQPWAASSVHVPACLTASCLQSGSEQEGAWGLLQLSQAGRWGASADCIWQRDTEWRGLKKDKLN